MPNSWFRFKQFTIHQNRCAHKVGTDGVLLGTWARHPSPGKILDVGSGSGLISLMMAQRFPQTEIVGVEKDRASYEQSLENIAASPFSDRIKIYLSDFLDWKTDERFDMIVSNPPFFMGAFSSCDIIRDNARHEQSLPHQNIITKAVEYLNGSGTLSLILPVEEAKKINSGDNLFLIRKTTVKGQPKAKDKRVLLEFTHMPQKTILDSLILRDAYGDSSLAHKKLAGDFLLHY